MIRAEHPGIVHHREYPLPLGDSGITKQIYHEISLIFSGFQRCFCYSTITLFFDYFVSFWEHKKYVITKKNGGKSAKRTYKMYGGYTFQVSNKFMILTF